MLRVLVDLPGILLTQEQGLHYTLYIIPVAAALCHLLIVLQRIKEGCGEKRNKA